MVNGLSADMIHYNITVLLDPSSCPLLWEKRFFFFFVLGTVDFGLGSVDNVCKAYQHQEART